MKKLIITCAMVAIASTASFAQAAKTTSNTNAPASQAATHKGPTAEQVADRRAKALQKQLGLTPEQFKGVYAAELDFAQQDQAARANGQMPGEGQASQMKMGRDQKIQAVLNADQVAKYNKMSAPASAPATKH